MYCRLPSNSHGSLSQIARRFVDEKYVTQWIRSHQQPGSDYLTEFIRKTFKIKTSHELIERIDEFFDESIPAMQAEAILNSGCSNILLVKSAHRLLVNSVMYHSKSYRNSSLKTCNYVASFIHNNVKMYGEIIRFVIFDNNYFVVIQMFKIVAENVLHDLSSPHLLLRPLFDKQLYGTYFKLVEISLMYICVPVIHLSKICILFHVPCGIYLTEIANMYEHD